MTPPPSKPISTSERSGSIALDSLGHRWVERAYGSLGTEEAEASMDHHRRSHTSALQAIDIAERAGAATLALHHLVPGTTPDSVWHAHAGQFSGRFLIPNDLAVISCARKTSEMAVAGVTL